ncbi:hypothetical protein C4K19_2214 [Pseudomonas chlororaphis subsp. aurantiaca]|nr:hypothetical protein C4K19_2214 [Pseudomonas chlororaphis subsp. aurantiaca]
MQHLQGVFKRYAPGPVDGVAGGGLHLEQGSNLQARQCDTAGLFVRAHPALARLLY